MANTDFDGTKLMVMGEGSTVALVVGERTYSGTLHMRENGFQENWYLKLTNVEPGEPDEVQIHKIGKAPEPKSDLNEITKGLDEIHEITKPKDGF